MRDEMNVVAVRSLDERIATNDCAAPVRLALLGTGNVGRAVLARLASWEGTALGERLSLVYAANSQVAVHLSPSPIGATTHSLPATGARVAERPHCDRGLGREAGVAVRGRRSVDAEQTTKFRADLAYRCSTSTALPPPHPPFGHLLPEGEGKQDVVRSKLEAVSKVLHGGRLRVVIDATASEAVAQRHAEWLAQGIHVVTACKLGQGTSLARWQAIREAAVRGGTQYGDSATVGAGLPLIRSIRELQAGGDRIHAIAGVLSGSLAWLFNHYDGMRPFSRFVREARDAGYTEPDPREDLSGEDVRRKILILARSAGVELDSDAVAVESLVPTALAGLAHADVDAALPMLDDALRERFAAARKQGHKLRFIARLERAEDGETKARVGLESLPETHPLTGGAGTDNKVAIWSDRYREQPLLIQGPGAGAQVTAAGLLDDVLRIVADT